MRTQKKPARIQPAPPATAKAPRRSRQKQPALPDLGPKQIKEVDDAAEEFVELRDARIKMHFEEAKAHEKLVELMKQHGLDTYRDDSAVPPLIVNLKSKTSAKVKKDKPKSETDDAVGGGGDDEHAKF